MHRLLRSPQQGILLPTLLLALMIVSLGIIFSVGEPTLPERESRSWQTLAQAKSALLARAVTDDNRPGSLPCPDLITDSPGLANFPGDGKADMFTLTQCPSYSGWLPWVTLDLPEARDASATPLWYLLSPNFRDDDSAQPINNESPGQLQADAAHDLAALLIAPGHPLGGQQRPSNRIEDYLEGLAAGSLRHVRTGGSNDLILPLSRKELMAATGKRVAGEVRNCLQRHALASANSSRRYPWPAPLGQTQRDGQSGSLFGRIPQRQASTGLSAQLQDNAQALLTAAQLQTDTPQQLRTLLAELKDTVSATRNLAETVHSIGYQNRPLAEALVKASQRLVDSQSTATANNRISRSEGEILRQLAATTLSASTALQSALADAGNDPYPEALDAALTAFNATPGLTTLAQLDALLSSASTLHPALATPLSNAQQASRAALLSLQSAATSGISTQEVAAQLDYCREQGAKLLTALHSSRLRVSADELHALAQAIAQAAPLPIPNRTLSDALGNAQILLQRLPGTLSELALTQNTVATTLTHISRSVAECAQICRDAAAQLSLLAGEIAEAEQHDNNLAHSSLQNAYTQLSLALMQFSTQDQANPRPAQKDLVPYTTPLGTIAVNLSVIGKISLDHFEHSALSALGSARVPAKAQTIASDSLYQSAQQLLTQLERTTGTLPNAAITALATQARMLAQQLSATQARALAVIWQAAACDFLRPDSGSWWQANRWESDTFFQIAGSSALQAGHLQVNQRGHYGLIVIQAGPPLLSGARRSERSEDHLEDVNADPSRNGSAQTPRPDFISRPLSATFNDQLAF